MFYFDDGNTLTVFFKTGESGVWKSDNPNYQKVKELAQKEEWIAVETLHNVSKAVLEDKVEIKNDKILAKTEDKSTEVELPKGNKLVKLINTLREKGIIEDQITKILPFLKKLVENEFIDALSEVYDFCNAGDFEITEDGNILAYKNVRKDLGSIYDKGNTKHVIGEYTEVETFDTDRNVTCSNGLHFCSRDYLASYSGEQTIIVEIDPRDIVSIPRDYSYQKGRCRKYKTIGILGKDGKLSTANIEAMSNGQVKVVKTKRKKMKDKKEAIQDAKAGNRLQQTADLMAANNNDIEKVANIMRISPETVKRNLRKLRQKEKSNA